MGNLQTREQMLLGLSIPGFLDHTLSPKQQEAAWKKLKFKMPKDTKREPTTEEKHWADYEQRRLAGLEKDRERIQELLGEAEKVAVEKRQERLSRLKERGSKRSSRAKMRAGLIAVKVIAKELGYHPRVVRMALRDAKYPKPAYGWFFTDKQVKEVTKLATSWVKHNAVVKKKKINVKKKAKPVP